VFFADGGGGWSRSRVPDVAIPARALVPGARPDQVYLLGSRGVYASTDRGRSFVRIGQPDLPDVAGHSLLVPPSRPEVLFVVQEGRLWASEDAGRSWAPRDAGLPPAQLQALAADRGRPGRLWAASARQLHVSDDLGQHWQSWGRPIGDAALAIHGVAVDRSGERIVLSTHKGLLRSADRGHSWAQVESTLPVHLEAGPLMADPHDAQSLYAGFSIVPYAELRRRAEQGTNLLSRLDPISVAGAVAFLLLLLIGGWFGARALARAYREA
jgi:photosystem II stability/assembly factor-like uncharacterized protein